MTVLVTGFEPFEGHAVNASWLAVQELVRTWRGPAIEAVRLPVSFRRAPGLLEEAVARTRPRAVVSVGEAGDADAVLVERVALNVADARIPDEDGNRPVDEPLVPGGPAAWFTALPLRACVDGAERAGVPARVSSSAGTYVCNAVFYRLATVLAGSDVPHGFVHVPRTPEQVAGTGRTGMAPGDAARGLAAVLEATLAR